MLDRNQTLMKLGLMIRNDIPRRRIEACERKGEDERGRERGRDMKGHEGKRRETKGGSGVGGRERRWTGVQIEKRRERESLI